MIDQQNNNQDHKMDNIAFTVFGAGTAGNKKWDYRFLSMAQMVASWSKDPSTQCGSVIVRPDRSVCSVGFNGFPRGCKDDSELYANRELKYARVVHGEVNAVLAAKERCEGYTMYCWPPGFGPSCDRCSTVIIQAGISRVVYLQKEGAEHDSRWAAACKIGLDMYREAQVQIDSYDLNDFLKENAQ